MVLENVSFYHKLIGAADKRDELKCSEDILKSFMGRSSLLDNICSSQLERIKNCQLPNIAQGCKKIERLIKCLDFILNNKDEILEREMSIALFGDSKLFEKELKSKICTLLENYCTVEPDVSSTDEKNLKKKRFYLIL